MSFSTCLFQLNLLMGITIKQVNQLSIFISTNFSFGFKLGSFSLLKRALNIVFFKALLLTSLLKILGLVLAALLYNNGTTSDYLIYY